jgi:hypothetical protein
MAWELPEHHQAAADQIPAEIKAQLRPHELLARCEFHAELANRAATIPSSMAAGFSEKAAAVLTAMTPRQFAADLNMMDRGIASVRSSLHVNYHDAARRLKEAHPQPPDEFLREAAATVAAAGGA